MREETHWTPESLISSAGSSARKDKDTWLRRRANVGHRISRVIFKYGSEKEDYRVEMRRAGSGFVGHWGGHSGPSEAPDTVGSASGSVRRQLVIFQHLKGLSQIRRRLEKHFPPCGAISNSIILVSVFFHVGIFCYLGFCFFCDKQPPNTNWTK